MNAVINVDLNEVLNPLTNQIAILSKEKAILSAQVNALMVENQALKQKIEELSKQEEPKK